jgi:hypothetical protein
MRPPKRSGTVRSVLGEISSNPTSTRASAPSACDQLTPSRKSMSLSSSLSIQLHSTSRKRIACDNDSIEEPPKRKKLESEQSVLIRFCGTQNSHDVLASYHSCSTSQARPEVLRVSESTQLKRAAILECSQHSKEMIKAIKS